MAGLRIVIDSNAEAVGAELGRIADRLGPAGMRSVYAQIGHYFERVTDQLFATETDPNGRPWAPLSEVTKAKKAKNAERILQEEGHLRDSFIYQIAADGLAFGTNDVRAATHQFGAPRGSFGRTKRGGPIPWGDIPARQMLGINDADRAEILDIFRDHLANLTR
jgi:phage virion morphogenesis protein